MKLRSVLIVATVLLGGMLLSGVVLAKDIIGGPRDDQLSGTNNADLIKGNEGADNIDGKNGEDTISGGKGRDSMRGGRAGDVVGGGPASDMAWGNQGNDRLKADVEVKNPGPNQAAKTKSARKPNRLLGGSGNDTFRARNGKRDIIRGGPGRDKAFVDRVDTVTGVEVERCGGGGCGGTNPPGGGGNSAPVAKNDCYEGDNDDNLNVGSGPWNQLYSDGEYNLLYNDTDPDSGDTLEAVKVSGPTYGTLTLNADGSFVYESTWADSGTPPPDSFTYKATDGAAESNVATVNIKFVHPAAPEGGKRVPCTP
jgi:VCBS repeat-containing protein